MLYEKIKEHTNSDMYPMHMPGHKRNKKFLPPALMGELDITEIDGFDDLHNPSGVLLDTETLASQLYGSRKAFTLVNGSTVGILAAIGAHTQHGDKMLAVGDYHWSTSNAAKLFGLELIKLAVDIDEKTGVPCSVSPEAVDVALTENPNTKLVVITSPTYEGVVSDVSAIAKVAHTHGCLLIVDSAHGAHLGFSDAFPKNAVVQGADVVVMSLHKTLPALTQCSLLHVCSERADVPGIRDMLYILQTSSPSYVLMSSIDYCLRLLKSDGVELFREYEKHLSCFSERISELKKIEVLYHGNNSIDNTESDRIDDNNNSHTSGNDSIFPHPKFYDFDMGKIVITTKNMPVGSRLLTSLLHNNYKIEIERICDDYVIAMTSICDTADGFIRLADALLDIDKTLCNM